MTRTAREVIELYNYELWNKNNLELAYEIIGETVIRHEVGRSIVQTQQEAIDRIKNGNAKYGPFKFELPLLVVAEDGEHVTIAFQYSHPGPDGEMMTHSSLEIYRVVNGKLVETWNATSEATHASGRHHELGCWVDDDGNWY